MDLKRGQYKGNTGINDKLQKWIIEGIRQGYREG
jgi:hypothetical protein